MADAPVSSPPATSPVAAALDSPIPMSSGPAWSLSPSSSPSPSQPQDRAAFARTLAGGDSSHNRVLSAVVAATGTPSISELAATSVAPAPAPVSSSTTIADLQHLPQQQELSQIYATVAASLAAHGHPPFILVPTSLFAASGATDAYAFTAAANAFPFTLATSQQQTIMTTTPSTMAAATASSAEIGVGSHDDEIMSALAPCPLASSTSTLSSSSPSSLSPHATFGSAPVTTSATKHSAADPANHTDTRNNHVHSPPISTPPGSPAHVPASASASPATALSIPRRHPRPDDVDPSTHQPSVTPPKLKRQRTRKTYSFTEKAQALDQLAAIRSTDPTISVERAARNVRINGLPIPDSTLHSWIADEPAIRKSAGEASKSTVRRCAGTILGPLLEEAIAEWAKREVEVGAAKHAGAALPATCPGLKIQQCARMVARKKVVRLKALGRPVSALLEAFCGSDGWLDRFKTRWGIKLNGVGTATAGSGQVASASASASSGASKLADVCGSAGSVWTEQKWDAVIDRIIAIECGGAIAESAVAAPAADVVAPAVNAGGEAEQAVAPMTCVMPTANLSMLSSASASASASVAPDSDSAGEDALSFLLNYSGPESSASIADICDCGTLSAAAAAAAASSTSPDGVPMSAFPRQQPLGPLAGLEELSLTPPALATFAAPQAMSSFSWFTANGPDCTLPASAAAASASSSTMTPIPLQQLLSIPLMPNEQVSTSAASAFLSFHELPQQEQQQHQHPAAYASSSPSYSPPTSPAFAFGPQLYSSPPSSPSGAYSAVHTFHDLHAHFVGTREWDVSVLAAAKEILVRNGEWVSGGEDADMLGAVRGV